MPNRKVSRNYQDLVEIIYKVADAVNLEDIEFITEYGYDDLDSGDGAVFKVQIKGYNGSKIKIKNTVIIKWHPEPEKRTLFRESYRREFVFYRYIEPRLLEIQRSFKVIEGLKIKFPNCIFASVEYDKESIAVLSLLESGFRFLDRFHKKETVHASLVLKNLAKLHALSFALEKINPNAFEEIKKLCSKDVQYSDLQYAPKFMKYSYNAAVNVISDALAKEKLKKLAPNFLSVLVKCSAPGSYSAICHGDCWNNNTLFKYQGRRPVDVIFVDYQVTRYASPVTDISYYLFMSTELDILAKNYDQLIDIYYGTLTAVLRQCDLDANEIYPRNIFQKHLRDYSVLGLIEALISMKIITASSADAFRMTEMKYQSDEEGLCVNEPENHALYIDRINGIVNMFFAQNYSLDAVLNTTLNN